MTRSILRTSVFVLAAAVAVAAQDQQQQVFRGVGDLVRIFATVTDRDGRLVTDLTQEDFQVKDEGDPQPITLFDNTPRPIRLVVMLDVSGSMEGNLGLLRNSTRELLARLHDTDLARLGVFGREITISPTFTRDPAELLGSLPAAIDPQALTPLWQAMIDAFDAFDAESQERRVVLVLSDGKDSGPTGFSRRFRTQFEVIDEARDRDIMVYAIGMRSRGQIMAPRTGIGGLRDMLTADLPDPGLARAALETGGGYTEIRPSDDLAAAFARVVDELHSQYLLGFDPPKRDGKVHDVEVEVARRGLETRARKSYTAPRATGG